MTIIESGASGSHESYSIPTIPGGIQGVTSEFGWVAGLNKNERLCQNKEGVIGDKYLAPEKAAWLFTAGRRWIQAYSRNSNGDSTEGVCDRIQVIADEVLCLINQPFKTPFDFYNNYSKRLQDFDNLYKEMRNSVAEGKGLNTLKETVLSCEANMSSRSVDSTSAKIIKIEETIEKVTLASVELKKKIDEYIEIQLSSQLKDGKTINVHLQELLMMILDPKKDFDVQGMNVNRASVLSAAVAKEVLTDAFGEPVVDDVFKMYQLHETQILDYDDFHALTMGIVSNLTYQDVHVIVKGQEGIAFEKLKSAFGAKLPTLAEDADVIEEKILFDILYLLRNVDQGSMTCPETKPYKTQFYGDLSSIESCNVVSEYDFTNSQYDSHIEELKTFGYIEHLARDHTYSRFHEESYQFRDGVVFPQFNEKGEKVCREGCKIFNKDFIFALGVSPVKGVSEEKQKVQIVFRGTADAGSVYRDIKVQSLYGGPGGNEFEANQEAIIANVEAFLSGLEMDDMTLEFSGHSLGSTDAMRMLKLWSEHAVMKRAQPAYSKVKTVNLTPFNGPGFDKTYRDILYNSIVALEDKQFNITMFTTHLDKVHKYGMFYAGQIEEGKAKPANLNRRWIQFNFMDNLTAGDSLAEVYNDGSVAGVGNAGYRKYTAHSHSYFKEHKRGTVDQPTPIHVRNFCMDSDEDKELIDDGSHSSQLPTAMIDIVFSTAFSYTKYLESLKDDE
jgi:beta-galactosidase beta subunit